MTWFGRAARRAISVVLVGLLLVARPSAVRADLFYVYDELNRLTAVVDAQGNAATYTYDAVGNLLRVDRFDAAQQPGPVRITLVTPTEGKVRTFATIR